jgi:FkbM family methyltransferase
MAHLLKLIRAWKPRTIESGAGAGLRFTVGPAHPEYATGANERPVQEALQKVLFPGQTFMDVGANVGFFAVIAARLVGPAGCVIAFEPVPTNRRVLKRNLATNNFRNVVVRNEAVADRSGESSLFLAEWAGGAALAGSDPPPDARGTMRVRTITIDDLVYRGEIPPPDVVKIDVEGAEYEVLLGMHRVIGEYHPILLLEFDARTRAGVDAKIAKCSALLEGMGYTTTILADSYPGGSWVVRHLLARLGTEG